MRARAHLGAMVAAFGAASCGGDPGPLVVARLVDATASLTRDDSVDTGTGSFVLEASRPDAEGADPDEILVVGANVLADSGIWQIGTIETDTKFPLEIDAGAVARARFSFSLVSSAATPAGWPRWCSPEVAPTTSLTLTANILDRAAAETGAPSPTPNVIIPVQPLGGEQPPASVAGASSSVRLGAGGNDTAIGVALGEAGGAFVTGTTDAGFKAGSIDLLAGGFLAVLDGEGALTHALSLPGAPLVAAGGDAVFVAGSFLGAVKLGDSNLSAAGGADAYVARVGAAGQPAWAKRFGDRGTQSVFQASAGPDGRLVLLVYDDGAADFGGGPLVGGTPGHYGIELIILDTEGNHVLSRRLPEAAQSPRVAVGSAGEIYLASSLAGAVDLGCGSMSATSTGAMGVVALEPDGTCAWARVVDGGGPTAIAAGGGGRLAIADAFSVRALDPIGQTIWARPLSASGGLAVSALAQDDAGRVLITGTASGTFDLGLGAIDAGVPVTFLLELGPDGGPTRNAVLGCADTSTPTISALASSADGSRRVLATSFQRFASFDQGPLSSAGGFDIAVAVLAP